MDVGRILTEDDTWDKASHSCNRPGNMSTPGKGAVQKEGPGVNT